MSKLRQNNNFFLKNVKKFIQFYSLNDEFIIANSNVDSRDFFRGYLGKK